MRCGSQIVQPDRSPRWRLYRLQRYCSFPPPCNRSEQYLVIPQTIVNFDRSCISEGNTDKLCLPTVCLLISSGRNSVMVINFPAVHFHLCLGLLFSAWLKDTSATCCSASTNNVADWPRDNWASLS